MIKLHVEVRVARERKNTKNYKCLVAACECVAFNGWIEYVSKSRVHPSTHHPHTIQNAEKQQTLHLNWKWNLFENKCFYCQKLLKSNLKYELWAAASIRTRVKHYMSWNCCNNIWTTKLILSSEVGAMSAKQKYKCRVTRQQSNVGCERARTWIRTCLNILFV